MIYKSQLDESYSSSSGRTDSPPSQYYIERPISDGYSNNYKTLSIPLQPQINYNNSGTTSLAQQTKIYKTNQSDYPRIPQQTTTTINSNNGNHSVL